MASVNNVYDNLYNNIKNRFTVESDNCEYSLGEYMLMKAKEKKASGSNLPVMAHQETRAIAAIFNYVNDKLTVKQAPEKDKTLKAFPFRTSVAAFLSSLLLCTVVFTYGVFALNSISSADGAPSTVELADEQAEKEIEEK